MDNKTWLEIQSCKPSELKSEKLNEYLHATYVQTVGSMKSGDVYAVFCQKRLQDKTKLQFVGVYLFQFLLWHSLFFRLFFLSWIGMVIKLGKPNNYKNSKTKAVAWNKLQMLHNN